MILTQPWHRVHYCSDVKLIVVGAIRCNHTHLSCVVRSFLSLYFVILIIMICSKIQNVPVVLYMVGLHLFLSCYVT